MWQHNVPEPPEVYLAFVQMETLQALRLLFGFFSYPTCHLTVHERKNLSHSNTTAKKEHHPATGSFLHYDKVLGGR